MNPSPTERVSSSSRLPSSANKVPLYEAKVQTLPTPNTYAYMLFIALSIIYSPPLLVSYELMFYRSRRQIYSAAAEKSKSLEGHARGGSQGTGYFYRDNSAQGLDKAVKDLQDRIGNQLSQHCVVSAIATHRRNLPYFVIIAWLTYS